MADSNPIKELNNLLNSNIFSRQNAEKVARVCYDAAKLVYERQKQMHKAELKPKEISAALLLAETIHSAAFRFIAEGDLAQLFGECSEETAIEYFEKHVMGEVTDKYGRKLTIDEDGMKSLYKEPASGDHIIASCNYEEVRGKRLPWIRHTLKNSTAIYVVEETMGRSGIRRTFLYTATVSIRLQNQQEQTSYYVVVIRETKNQILRMVTAYSMFDRGSFLHAIALSRGYVPQNKQLGERIPSLPAASNSRS